MTGAVQKVGQPRSAYCEIIARRRHNRRTKTNHPLRKPVRERLVQHLEAQSASHACVHALPSGPMDLKCVLSICIPVTPGGCGCRVYASEIIQHLVGETISMLSNKLLGMLFSHIKQALNSNENQCQHANTDSCPPRAQCTVKLEYGNDGAVDQNPEQSADYIPGTAG